MSTLFLILTKLVVLPLYPLGFGIVVAIAGLALGVATRLRKTAFFLILLAPCELVYFSTPVLVKPLIVSLESKYLPMKTYPHASALVVLGGSSVPPSPPRLRPEINDAGDRILYTGVLFRDSLAPSIITNGRCLTCLDQYRESEAAIDASLLTEIFKIAPERIILEPRARNTHEHAVNLDSLFRARAMPKTIILITSAAHMFRSVAVFRKRGFTVYPAPTDFHYSSAESNDLMNYFPSADTFATATSMLHEIYGILGYKLLGWI